MRENPKANLRRKPCRENKEGRQPLVFRQLAIFRLNGNNLQRKQGRETTLGFQVTLNFQVILVSF
jgi:hypothetical protein